MFLRLVCTWNGNGFNKYLNNVGDLLAKLDRAIESYQDASLSSRPSASVCNKPTGFCGLFSIFAFIRHS